MQDFLKRFWFVTLVGVLFIFAIGYYVVDQSKEVLKGKKVDGKDIVFEINGEYITADDFYDELVDQIGISATYSLIEKAVVKQIGESTADIESEAKIQADNTINSFKEYYGDEYEAVLLQSLQAVGYQSVNELKDYFLHLFVLDELTLNYLYDNQEDFIAPFLTSNKPRLISHILIAMDDPDNPTEEEQTRWDNAIDALDSGEAFEDVATEYSDDTASATNKGSLGYVDANTEFVPEFLNAALALDSANPLSVWVKTTYGYHLIRLDAADLDSLKQEDGFKSAILSANSSAQQKMIWTKAQELNLVFHGEQYENLKDELENFINPPEDE